MGDSEHLELLIFSWKRKQKTSLNPSCLFSHLNRFEVEKII